MDHHLAARWAMASGLNSSSVCPQAGDLTGHGWASVCAAVHREGAWAAGLKQGSSPTLPAAQRVPGTRGPSRVVAPGWGRNLPQRGCVAEPKAVESTTTSLPSERSRVAGTQSLGRGEVQCRDRTGLIILVASSLPAGP